MFVNNFISVNEDEEGALKLTFCLPGLMTSYQHQRKMSQFTDVVIQCIHPGSCDSTLYSAHSSLLIRSSPYFSLLMSSFITPTYESYKNVDDQDGCLIDGISYDRVDNQLRFIINGPKYIHGLKVNELRESVNLPEKKDALILSPISSSLKESKIKHVDKSNLNRSDHDLFISAKAMLSGGKVILIWYGLPSLLIRYCLSYVYSENFLINKRDVPEFLALAKSLQLTNFEMLRNCLIPYLYLTKLRENVSINSIPTIYDKNSAFYNANEDEIINNNANVDLNNNSNILENVANYTPMQFCSSNLPITKPHDYPNKVMTLAIGESSSKLTTVSTLKTCCSLIPSINRAIAPVTSETISMPFEEIIVGEFDLDIISSSEHETLYPKDTSSSTENFELHLSPFSDDLSDGHLLIEGNHSNSEADISGIVSNVNLNSKVKILASTTSKSSGTTPNLNLLTEKSCFGGNSASNVENDDQHGFVAKIQSIESTENEQCVINIISDDDISQYVVTSSNLNLKPSSESGEFVTKDVLCNEGQRGKLENIMNSDSPLVLDDISDLKTFNARACLKSLPRKKVLRCSRMVNKKSVSSTTLLRNFRYESVNSKSFRNSGIGNLIKISDDALPNVMNTIEVSYNECVQNIVSLGSVKRKLLCDDETGKVSKVASIDNSLKRLNEVDNEIILDGNDDEPTLNNLSKNNSELSNKSGDTLETRANLKTKEYDPCLIKCILCNLTSSMKDVLIHLRSDHCHNMIGTINCLDNLCPIILVNSNFEMHMMNHLEKNGFDCPFCSYSSVSNKGMILHKAKHESHASLDRHSNLKKIPVLPTIHHEKRMRNKKEMLCSKMEKSKKLRTITDDDIIHAPIMKKLLCFVNVLPKKYLCFRKSALKLQCCVCKNEAKPEVNDKIGKPEQLNIKTVMPMMKLKPPLKKPTPILSTRSQSTTTLKDTIQCRLCRLKLSLRDIVQHYVDSHVFSFPFLCPFNNCPVLLNNERTVINHLEGHIRPKKYSCPLCNFSSKSSNGIRFHSICHVNDGKRISLSS